MKGSTEQILEVVNLDCKKHIKIWKLHLLELDKKEIAGTLGTNYGHVYNVIKQYNKDVIKQSNAEQIK
jgi:hypothetical protein